LIQRRHAPFDRMKLRLAGEGALDELKKSRFHNFPL
jgi:hypothetical protein